jgi:hypothetical protein
MTSGPPMGRWTTISSNSTQSAGGSLPSRMVVRRMRASTCFSTTIDDHQIRQVEVLAQLGARIFASVAAQPCRVVDQWGHEGIVGHCLNCTESAHSQLRAFFRHKAAISGRVGVVITKRRGTPEEVIGYFKEGERWGI